MGQRDDGTHFLGLLLRPDPYLFVLFQGIEKTLIREGSGPMPQKGQLVVVHCTGRLSDGKKFWSTKDPGQNPFQFHVGLGQVLSPILVRVSLRHTHDTVLHAGHTGMGPGLHDHAQGRSRSAGVYPRKRLRARWLSCVGHTAARNSYF